MLCTGKQRENPLVLLGQYSDDELDEGSSGEHMDAASGGTSVILDNQVILRSHIFGSYHCLEVECSFSC